MDEITNISVTLNIVLTILLIISEVLGWSDCRANAITQLHRCLHCSIEEDPEIPLPTRVTSLKPAADAWSE